MSCKDVFTDEERKHLEEVLHGDLDGYWEEIKDVFIEDDNKTPRQLQDDNRLQKDFLKWRKTSTIILKKCDLNDWKIEGEPIKPQHIKSWEEFMEKQKRDLDE